MKKFKERLLCAVYLFLAFLVFYLENEGVMIGGFGFMYQYLVAGMISLLALFVFLFRADGGRMLVTLKYCGVLCVPYLWMILYSMLVWSFGFTRISVMIRGCFFVVYQLIAVFAAASTLYLFGERGVFLLVGGLLLANGCHVLKAIADYGAVEFLRQYFELIVSFTGKTGPIMKSFELRNYAYMLGFFLLFFALTFREHKKAVWLVPICIACILLALKRTVVMAAAGALVICVPFLFLRGKDAFRMAMILCRVGVIAGILYIFACYYGFFDWLESIGIDTNLRALFYSEFKQYYEIGLGYFGRGIGYVSKMMAEGGEIHMESGGYVVRDIHNDFLRQYIELGLIGYLIWLWTFLNYRVKYFFHEQNTRTDIRHGVIVFGLILADYFTLMTENSLYYAKLTLMISLLIMSYHYDEYCMAGEKPDGGVYG